MNTYINNELWQEIFSNWIITGCAVRDKSIIYCCLRKDLPHEQMKDMWDSEIPSRLVALYLDTPDDPYGWKGLAGFARPIVGISHKPVSQGLLISRGLADSTVSVMGKGKWPLEHIIEGQGAGTANLRCIDGYTYAASVHRKIYKRVDIGQWVSISHGIPTLSEEEWTLEKSIAEGFLDIDGFSEQDMYAVGGRGDVWRYNGERWSQCAFPSNEQINTVLCAPDGNVYIGGEGCSLWVGKEHTWTKVYQGNSTILWNQLRWFNNQVWLCSDYQLRVWDGKAMQYVMDGDKKVVFNGHMDAYDGILVIAGSYRVDRFDGQQWHSIVKSYS
ncbi:beta propeller repeat protein [Metapseudomonas resinovorans]|uniref:hypothetical protein n=1 Tax=Metapseudomonas resinovorans TaxID=53412 RepID=UPI000567F50D|nr:hypothetical protein [Pseudomonas resinovorans]